MNISSSMERSVKPAELPLEKMASDPSISQKEKLAEVSRQFEAILVRQILSESQKTQLDSKAASGTSAIYRDMVTTQLAQNISRSGTVGLSSIIEKQLGRQVLNSDAAVTNSKGLSVRSKL